MLNIAYSGVNPSDWKAVTGRIKLLFPPSHRQGQTHQWEIWGRKNPTYILSLAGAQLDRGLCWGQISTLALGSPAWDTVGWQRSQTLLHPCCCHCTSPWGDLLLLLCGCLHCQGMGKFSNILLVQQEKVFRVQWDRLFWLQKTQRWRGYCPSLASASCQQHLLEVICSLPPSLHGHSVIPFCQNDPTCKSPF